MTVENDGSTHDGVLPSEGEDETSEDAVVLDLEALDQISPDEAATEHGQAPARVLEAITGDSRERLGELVQRAVAPQIGETTKHLGEVLGGIDRPAIDPKIFAALDGFQSVGVYKAILENSAIATRSSALSGFAEVLGRSAADRAAFSLASGLKGSDSVSSVIGKLMADTDGLGLSATSNVIAALGATAKGFSAADVGLTSHSSLASLAKDLGPKIDISGFQAALGQSVSIRRLTEGFIGSDIGRTRSLAMQQLVATSGIANLIGSDKMVASWRQSLLSEATARSLIGTMALPDSGASLLRDIVGANTAIARVVGRYAEQNKANILAPAISARPTRELRSFLAGMPVAPDLDELTFAVRASRSVAGIAAADLLVADGNLDDEAGELLEAEIVEPWLTGPEASRSLLFTRLGVLDPYVPDLLRGAWSQVEADGPAATSMASHAVQEAIDRTLRAIAPNDVVLRLYSAGRLPNNAVYEKDGERHPTRTGRIAAALHERHPGQTKLIAAQAKALATSVAFLTENLQSGKHASAAKVGLVRTWLVSVEATFTQLLYEPGDS